ncbi:FtsX-like permease family protein [Pseudobythopirellula maris]|uniref:FtsX-like permease family protein n=1 Tax=Pseudobythopirellula maris TaxID=2527991 RepID=A0A5C5ZJX5_9BACT|nr:FtsX-like permease family protein [Pseudobythopirellula maris]TWT87689.1 FtsX-like permease family protein [Pseudobythopirellula maris]
MLALDRKLVRDIGLMKGQTVAIALVVAAGVATFVNSQSMLRSLESTRSAFYDRYRFADVFAGAKRAPNSLRDRLGEIPGVAQVETRIVQGVNLDVPGLVEPATAQLVSVPDGREPLLNRLYLREGRRLEAGRDDEVLASEKFVEANHLVIGDALTAVINGRKKDLRLAGVVLSPEYVMQVKPGDLVPDAKHYAVLWMNEEALSRAFDMEGAFNDVSVELMRGASEEEVIFRLDRLLEPYGGRGAYARRDQLSHLLTEGDIEGLKTMGLVAPAIFLGVAAFLLNVVLTRLLSLQREQIAALKAFGYTNRDVGWHYLKFVLLVTLAGSAIGVVGGVFLSRMFTRMIAEVYQYPELLLRVRWDVVALAAGVALMAATLGAFGAVMRAVRLPPAEAMRPEPPASFKATIVERLGLGAWLPNVARMVIRELERKPIKSGFSIFAIALSVAIVVVANCMQDSIDHMLDLQFFQEQRYDLMVTTFEPLSVDLRYALASVPGVRLVEPFRTAPTRFHAGSRSRRVSLMGLERGGELRQIVGSQGEVTRVPPGGLVVSSMLAQILGVGVGDFIEVEALEGERRRLSMPIVATVNDASGLNAYAEFNELNRLLGDGPRANGALVAIDPAASDAIYQDLKDIPAVAGVSIKRNALESFRGTIAKNMLTMRAINLMFSIIIATGVVYNGARIALSERSRELATLRVIGFTRQEISAILLGELGILTLLALPLGLVMGYGMAAFLLWFLQQEVFRFPMTVENSTYGLAASVVLAASIASALLVRNRLDHLDLIAVLKSRE